MGPGLGQMTIRWKSASSLVAFLSRVWTSIAFGLVADGVGLGGARAGDGGAVLLRAAMLAQPLTLTGKTTVTAPPLSVAVMPASLARASVALPRPAGLSTTAQ